MSDLIKDIRNLPLGELIGAPLLALVEAEAQAARATVEFIEQVGFSRRPFTAGGGDEAQVLDVGAMRMAEFEYQKADEVGNLVPFRVRVPVLALVPIPGVRVRTAKLSFTAKLTDVREEGAATSQSKPAGQSPSWLRPALTKLRAGPAPRVRPGDPASSTRGTFELDIEIEVESMPIAPGLEKIFAMLEQAIDDRKKE